jgi:hypothetical protein
MEEDHRFERRAKRASEEAEHEKDAEEEEHGEEEEKPEGEAPDEEPEKEQATGEDNLEASAKTADNATVILMLNVLMSERSNWTGRCIECSEYVSLGVWLIGSEGAP